MRSLISVADLSQDDFRALVDAASAWFAAGPGAASLLAGRVIGLYFAQPSTRTRTAFTAAALRMAAGVVTYGPNDLQLSTGESEEDTGEVLAPMLDAVVVRASGDHRRLTRLGADGRLPIINAMNTLEHPTQAIGDLATMRAHRGGIDGVRVLYVGEANSTTMALAHALMKVPSAMLTIAAPTGYGFDAATLGVINAQGAANGAQCSQVPTVLGLAEPGAGHPDFVYTTQWQTTGTTKADPNWRTAFYPEFQVNTALMAPWPKARVLHDLP